MTVELLLGLAGFSLVTSISPGPSNLILLASGVNFGFRRSLPLVFGINLGFLSMLLLVGLGLGPFLQANPMLYLALKIACILYVLWLAWKVAWSDPRDAFDKEAGGTQITFVQAALLQWVNPKAWAVALIATVSYTTTANYTLSLLLMIALFAVVNLPSISAWALFGFALRRFLMQPARLRAFNIAMALLLVGSMTPILLDFVSTI